MTTGRERSPSGDASYKGGRRGGIGHGLAFRVEAGLRNLERVIANVCRKTARQFAEGRKRKVRVIRSSLEAHLGPQLILRESAMEQDQVGAATGLAWTQAGGDVLFVEATTMKGSGKLILTGQLGDVMKESAQAALSFARARSAGPSARCTQTVMPASP